MAAAITPASRRRFDLGNVTHLAPGAASRIVDLKGASAGLQDIAGGQGNDDGAGLAPERVLALARAVESAKLSLAFSLAARVTLPENDRVRREAICWRVVEASDRKYAAGLGLGSGLRAVLLGLFVETLGGETQTFDSLPGARQRALSALVDADLVRVLARLRPGLSEDLRARLAARGVDYPENPYVLSENYSIIVKRDLEQVPEVRALIEEPSFSATGNPARAQKLVFDALRLYPPTMAWMTQALEALGANSKSAFVPGSLDALGYSIMFTVVRKDERLWREIGPAVAYARRMFMNFGDRVDPLFSGGRDAGGVRLGSDKTDQVPWHVLGRAYRDFLQDQKPEDCFAAFSIYRSIFTSGQPVGVERFYRNVAVLFLRLQEPGYAAPKTLFVDLATDAFEPGFILSRHEFRMSAVYNRLQENYVKMGARDGFSPLPAFFAARSPEARLENLGRVLSNASYSTAFFDPDSPMFLDASADSREYFMTEPEIVDSEGGVDLRPGDSREIIRLCSVLQLFKDNQLSVPYTIAEVMAGFGHSAEHFGMPPASVSLFLGALPESVASYSPISAVVRLLGESISTDAFREEGVSMENSVRNVLKLVMSQIWGEGMNGPKLTGAEAGRMLGALDDAEDLEAMFSLVNKAGYVFSRKDFNRMLVSFGGEALLPGEAGFSYDASGRDSLGKVLSVPLGVCLLDKAMEPSNFAILRAGAHFEQAGKEPDAYWSPYLDGLQMRVSANPLPVLQGGAHYYQAARMVTPGLLEQGWQAAYAHVLGKPASEPLGAVSLPGVVPNCRWDSAASWNAAAEGLLLLEQQVGRVLGGESLESVPSFMRLAAACYPEHDKFFLSSAELAETLLVPKNAPVTKIDPRVLDCIRRDMASIEAGISDPVFSPRRVIEVDLAEV